MRNSVLATVLFAFLVHGTPARTQDLIYASPRPTYSPAPNYPEAVREAGIQGVVAIQVRIDGSGNVTEARAISGPAQLQDSALQTAKTWKFEPTIIAGTATSVVTTVNLRFGTSLPAASTENAVPLPAMPGRFGVFAAIDGDKVIGSLKWEIREAASGKTLASGDGPVHLKDVEIDVRPTANGRITPKTIRLTDEFTMRIEETPAANVSDK